LARDFFVATRAAERRVEGVVIERLFERLRLHDVRVQRRTVAERVDIHLDARGVDVDKEIEPESLGGFVAKRDHLTELPGRIDVQKRKGRLRRKERLDRQVQHHRAVLADGIEHDGPLALGHHLAHDVDALGLETLEMRQSPRGRRHGH
jgi:hypothetical protein